MQINNKRRDRNMKRCERVEIDRRNRGLGEATADRTRGWGVGNLWEDLCEELSTTVKVLGRFPGLEKRLTRAGGGTICRGLPLSISSSIHQRGFLRPSAPRASHKLRRRAEPRTFHLRTDVVNQNPSIQFHRTTVRVVAGV